MSSVQNLPGVQEVPFQHLPMVMVLTRSLQCRKQRQHCQRGFGDVAVAEVKAAWLKQVVR